MRTVLENQQRQRTLQIANSIEKLLATALSEGGVEIEVEEARIIIRVAENGTFGSGTATVTPAFASLLVELSSLLSGLSGTLSVHGHTDNVPIRTAQFRSNWDLSAMRAASVANVLIEDGNMAPERLIIQGFAETRPVASNTTSDGRAANRRVELLIDASAPVELAAMSSESSGDIAP